MHVIDLRDASVAAIKLLTQIQSMNTRLVSVVVDVSGSSPPDMLETGSDIICDILSMTGEGHVNVVAFDHAVEFIDSCAKHEARPVLRQATRSGGGGGNGFAASLDVLRGVSPASNLIRPGFTQRISRIMPRVGPAATSPVILLTDGMLQPEQRDFADWATGRLHPSKLSAPFDNSVIMLKWPE